LPAALLPPAPPSGHAKPQPRSFEPAAPAFVPPLLPPPFPLAELPAPPPTEPTALAPPPFVVRLAAPPRGVPSGSQATAEKTLIAPMVVIVPIVRRTWGARTAVNAENNDERRSARGIGMIQETLPGRSIGPANRRCAVDCGSNTIRVER
jgi:hypothetical protein